MAKYEYATRSKKKTTNKTLEAIKASLIAQAGRNNESIAGFRVYTSKSHPKLQIHESTRGIEHTIIEAFTSQRELDRANVGADKPEA